ncbi:ATP-binding protein [Streptomyces sp. NPDC026672]|uniref:ATP-binding protein n=1 Tax=unclassified Streptomyces TaxID=2593676 RepID=UPI0033EE8A0B
MTALIQDSLLWILLFFAAAFAVTAFAVLRARRTNMALRRDKADLQNELNAAHGRIGQVQSSYQSLDSKHAQDLAEVGEDAKSATKSVLKSAMGTLQSQAEELQVLIDRLQEQYGDNSSVLGDLMLIDHTSSQFGRRAKGISVLCGGWLGRRDAPASVYDVARSAQGRIKDYERIRVNAQVNISIAAKAVEAVAVVLAELLDNATKYSAPGTPVEISLQSVPTGVCVIIDDAGLGMSQETKDRAVSLLAATDSVDLTGLGDPPKFGFAVCGMLASRHGFSVSVDSVSPYGGVRAVIRVPDELLTTEVPEPAVPDHRDETAPRRRVAVAVPGPTHIVGTTVGGLPKRKRRPVSVVRSADEPVAQEEEAVASDTDRSNANTAAQLAAFARGTRLGRVSNNTEGSEHK